MYIKIPSTYPYSLNQLRIDNPGTSFPDQMPDERLTEWGVFPVVPSVPPEILSSQTVEEITPIEINGVWTQQWQVRELTAEEIQLIADDVRAERTRLLQESDWTQVADAPVDKVLWAEYRQALRDVTSQPGFPTSVIWPVKPSSTRLSNNS